MIRLPDLWEQPFTEPELATSIAELDAGNETATGYGAGDPPAARADDRPEGAAGPGTRRRAAAPAAHAAGHLFRAGPRQPVTAPGLQRRRHPGRRAPGLGLPRGAGPAALLPAAGPGAAHRVRQRPAARQPRAFGMARPGVRLRPRRSGGAPGGAPRLTGRSRPAGLMAAPYRSAASRAGR